MPAMLPVPGVIRFAFRGTSAGQAVVNVFHVRAGIGLIDQTLINAITSSVRAAYESNFVPRLNGSYSGDTCRAVDLTSALGVEATQALGGTPGATSTTSPNSVACCVTWKINRHYRGGHPRSYIGPIHSSQYENQTSFTSGLVTQMTTSANAFRTAVNAVVGTSGNCELVAVHRVSAGSLLDPPEVSPITSAVVDARIDTMRRRLGRDR
jgi:hypothetical protein